MPTSNPTTLLTSTPPLSRRDMLRLGGATAALGIVATSAACSSGDPSPDVTAPTPHPTGDAAGTALVSDPNRVPADPPQPPSNQSPFKVLFDSPDFDGELKRSLGKAWCGMSSVGEVLACAHRITDGDVASWRNEFGDLAQQLAAEAKAAEEGGFAASAHQAWLRACEYHRQSFFFDRQDPNSDVVQQGWANQRDAFRRAMTLAPVNIEVVELPYENGTTLDGYLFRPRGLTGLRPTLVLPGGFDGTAEEMWSLGAAGAVGRGWNALVFDGPGQGGSLYTKGLTFRPDYEAVLAPVLEWARQQSGVDTDRVVLMGRSFGGYLAPRAAAALDDANGPSALIADPGQPDTGALIAAKAAIEAPATDMSALVAAGDATTITAALDPIVNGPDPLASFFWTSRMSTFGTATVGEFVLAAQQYRFDPQAITVPTVVTQAEADILASQATSMASSLGSNTSTFLAFTVAEGAGDHCEALNEELFERRAYDWVEGTLSQAR